MFTRKEFLKIVLLALVAVVGVVAILTVLGTWLEGICPLG